MKLILAHELAHVFGIKDQYNDAGHDNSQNWTCVMNNFSSSYLNRTTFISSIEANPINAFCPSCRELLGKCIWSRNFPAS